MCKYDAIVILAGGLENRDTPKDWVFPRLEKAIGLENRTRFFITSSAWSVHKPAFMNENGLPVYESVVMARYLASRGIDDSRIIPEITSLDTIGNAYFTRTGITDPMGLRKLLVITSSFHMTRTRWLFERIFWMSPDNGYKMEFVETPNSGMDKKPEEMKIQKEKKSLGRTRCELDGIEKMKNLSEWMFTEHDLYSFGKNPEPVKGRIVESY